VFALYEHDVTGRSISDVLGRDTPLFAAALTHAVLDYQEELDELISRHSQGWALGRIAPLERNIMRVALLELLHPDLPPGDTPIPPEGAIDEAVEITKAYCGADAPGFVNGILGAVLRERETGAAA
jgi:N utilization substance protein B